MLYTTSVNDVVASLQQDLMAESPEQDGSVLSRAEAAVRITAAFQGLADAVTQQASDLGCKNVQRMLAADFRTACADLIPIVVNAEGEVKSIPQFYKAAKGWILCAGGKVQTGDKSVEAAAIREGSEELGVEAKQIAGCHFVKIFDDPAHDDRGRLTAVFAVAISDRVELKPSNEMDKKGISLKFYDRKEFSELVAEEAKGKLIGHMLIRAALEEHLCAGTSVQEWKTAPEPVLCSEANYQVLVEQMKAQEEKVVSEQTVERIESAFKTAVSGIKAISGAKIDDAWSSKLRDTLFKPWRKWVATTYADLLKQPANRMTMIEAMPVEVRVNGVCERVGMHESLATAAYRVAMSQREDKGYTPLTVTVTKLERDFDRQSVVALCDVK